MCFLTNYGGTGVLMTDNGTLRDHLADVINERNELLRKVELLEARIDVLTKQLSALWKVDND
jgi:hypothetical protein